MPYKTPEGFLDKMQAHVWEELRHELPQRHKHKTFRLRLFAGATVAAASIALLLVSHFALGKQNTDFSQVEQAFAKLSREDRAYMLTIYQEDVFLNE